jgi:hypothetical protein
VSKLLLSGRARPHDAPLIHAILRLLDYIDDKRMERYYKRWR